MTLPADPPETAVSAEGSSEDGAATQAPSPPPSVRKRPKPGERRVQILHTLADEDIIERLTQVRGIGRWTVEMLLMSRLGRPDILPVDDFGVRNGFRLAYGLRGMPTTRALAEYGARWAPYRSVAAWYLWRAVDLHRDGKLPAPPLATRVKLVKKKARSAAEGPMKRPKKKPAFRRARQIKRKQK